MLALEQRHAVRLKRENEVDVNFSHLSYVVVFWGACSDAVARVGAGVCVDQARRRSRPRL